MKKLGSNNHKKKQEGYALVTALLLGVLLGIFALTMVRLLMQETRDTVAVQNRAETLSGADAAVDRAMAKLKLLNSWDEVPNLFEYRGETIFTDIPGIKYTVEIVEGDEIDPPGLILHERTVRVRAKNDSSGLRRQIEAVISRQPFTSAVSSEGGLSIAGKAEIFWGNIYHFDPGTDMDINNNQQWGAGRPKAYSRSNINANNHPGNPTFTDCHEDNYYFANADESDCEGLPNPPVIDWMDLRQRAEDSNCGDWTSHGFCTPDGFGGCIEKGLLFKFGDSDYPGSYGNPDADWSVKILPRITAMTADCGYTGADWDTQVVYVDTFPAGEIPYFVSVGDNNHPKTIKQTGNPPMFRGTMVTAGKLEIVGGGGTMKTMTAPPGEWLPPTAGPMLVNFHGLLVTGGKFAWAGNPVLYGSVVSFGSFSSVGGIQIYFDHEFPYEGVSGGTFAVTTWRETKPDFTNLP